MSSKDYPYFVGVDLGGTNMKIGVMDNHGKLIFYNLKYLSFFYIHNYHLH